MTKEELEKDYYADRPTEPYSDDDSPNDWANIAHYAEENLEKAFKRIAELEAQIEKMKCCGNCENGELSAHEEPCLHCQRCFASTDVTDQENVKDYWEAIKEIKER